MDFLFGSCWMPSRQFNRLVCATAGSLGFPAAKVVERMNRDRRPDLDVIGGMLSPACYIEHSFPAVLYLAARYPDDFEAALVANTNVGGDNCHRGAVLGDFWVRHWVIGRSPIAGSTACEAVPS